MYTLSVRERWHFVSSIAVSTAVFIVDIFTPPLFGLAVIPHLLSVALAMGGRSVRVVWLVTSVAVALSIIGYFVKAPTYTIDLFLVNRTTMAGLLVLMGYMAGRIILLRNAEFAREAAELESRNKTAFLARISHHFRTPLNAINGFGELIQNRKAMSLSDEKITEYAEDVSNSSNHLLAICEDLIELEQLGTGASIDEGKKQWTNLGELLKASSDDQKSRIANEHIEFSVEIADDLPSCLIDPSLMLQAFNNLVLNAVNSIDGTGKITFWASPEGSEIVVRITDTGAGITPDRLLRINQPLSQKTSDPTIAEDGVGLGMTIAKSIIEAHGGAIHYQSQVGQGSTVSISIPIKQDAGNA